ncbi:MAG: spermidine synthase [Flavobacteriales bacterium]
MKKLLSYLVPLKGKVYKSEINGQLELNWYEGKLMLDSKNANYSYGALQRALAVGLHGIGNSEIKQSKNILILGMGAGCVIETLRKDFQNEGEITAVEIDKVVVDIAKKYFDVGRFSNLKIVQDDAYAFIQNNKAKHDLIIVDLFIDKETPTQFSSEEFLQNVVNASSKNGNILFNTVNIRNKFSERNNTMISFFEKHGSVKVMKGIEGGNDLILIKIN